MNFIDMSDYNRAVRIYWWGTAALGALAIGCAAAGVARLETGGLFKVGILMSVVFLAGLRPIRVPSTQSFITPGDVFIFLTALFLGAPAATLVAVTDAFAASCRKSRRWTSRIGGPALMSIAILVSATAFQMALEWLRASSLLGSTSLLTTLLLFSLVFFLLNSLLMAVHQSLKRRESLFALWWANYSWAGLTYVASASAAGLIYLGVIQYGITLLIAAGPLVAIIFATCHFYFKQTEERTLTSERISRMHLATVEALATAIDAKDQITHDHVYRVQVYATGLARHFKLTGLEIEALKAGALLHDVGKIAVPDYILNKPGKLTAAEFEKMKIHTIVGAEIMERVNFPYPVVPIVRHHHERWDGRGYPDALAGEQIPITARILTVVDCFDAVREDRQYRLGMTREQACNFLRENAGKQFDPHIVEAFLLNLPKYEEEIAAHKANQQPILSPTTQAGISESGRNAVPAAGLAQTADEPPGYLKQIHAAHAEVAALYEMAQTFSASLEVRDVVTLTVNRLERMVPFTTCVVYLRQKDDDATVAAYVFGQNADHIRGRSLAAGRGIAGWVVLNGRPMSNADPMLDLSEFHCPGETGYRAAAVFPLIEGDEAIGALALYTSELDCYSSDHLHLLESVSRLTSTALRHAVLYEQTKASGQTDSLTGLPNGRALYARFESEMATAREEGTGLTILSFNLSGMRAINDAYGYQVGDKALAKAARRLVQVIGGQGLMSRIAGDEFTCLLRCASKHQATRLGERAQSEMARLKIEVQPGVYAGLGLGFGVAEYGADGQTADELLHAAGAATRRNKALRGQAGLISDHCEPRLMQFPHSTETKAEPVAVSV